MSIQKIGFGGGCHWCTEAVFQSFKEVLKVEQGWIASYSPYEAFSEAVVVNYDSDKINLSTLIKIHLATHSSQNEHSMRTKYRSAVYYYDTNQANEVNKAFEALRERGSNYITKIIQFKEFRSNSADYLNYYSKNPNAPFCKKYILPKLQELNTPS